VTVHGIDISHNNGTVNFDALLGSVAFVYIKATQGLTFNDPKFDENMAGAKRTLRLRGAYHFMDETDAAAQARHFASVVGKPGSGNLPPILDVEGSVLNHSPSIVASRIRAFFATADKLVGRKCGIYLSDSTPTFLGSQWSSLSAGRLVWIARYGKAPVHPCHIWQYDGTGTDRDAFQGTLAQLDQWAHIGTKRLLRLTRPYMHGADVTAVQVALNRKRVATGTHAWGPVAPDGVYGPKTAATVLAFKRTTRLPHNAIVGAGTRKALGL
jgi:hypothetical protein